MKLFYFLKQNEGTNVERKLICILKIIYFGHSEREPKNEDTLLDAVYVLENIVC